MALDDDDDNAEVEETEEVDDVEEADDDEEVVEEEDVAAPAAVLAVALDLLSDVLLLGLSRELLRPRVRGPVRTGCS